MTPWNSLCVLWIMIELLWISVCKKSLAWKEFFSHFTCYFRLNKSCKKNVFKLKEELLREFMTKWVYTSVVDVFKADNNTQGEAFREQRTECVLCLVKRFIILFVFFLPSVFLFAERSMLKVKIEIFCLTFTCCRHIKFFFLKKVSFSLWIDLLLHPSIKRRKGKELES